VGASFFHPSGFGASLIATYWNQDGSFFNPQTATFRQGHDEFATVDTALNYRLPQRHGIVTIGVTNLFDQKFNYYEVDFKNQRILPDRMFFMKVTLTVP
jgi:outer membrane receptor protein involved in Fe transport